jgi:hypothetical protein
MICEPVSWESDFSDDEQTPAGQFEDIGTGSDWDINNNDPNLPQENTEQRSSSLIDPRNTPIHSPISSGQKLMIYPKYTGSNKQGPLSVLYSNHLSFLLSLVAVSYPT